LLLYLHLHAGCGWELQHGCALPLRQISEKNDFSVRELQRIVMSMRVVAVDLSKPGYSLLDFPMHEEPNPGLVSNYLLKGQLGSRKEAHSHIRFTRPGEAAGN